jgi:hypothetical protein
MFGEESNTFSEWAHEALRKIVPHDSIEHLIKPITIAPAFEQVAHRHPSGAKE